MMQMPLQRLLFDKGNGNGNGQGWVPTQNELQDMLGSVTNGYFLRESVLAKWMDPRRDYDKECGYPDTASITAEVLRRIYERDPIGRRVVRFLPEECWQKPPDVFEDEDPNTITEFEQAWYDLGRSMRSPSGETWFADQEGSAIWEAMIRLDVLSRIGQYGVMLMGYDDGQEMDQPVRGVEEEGSVPVLQEYKDGQPQFTTNEQGLKCPSLKWPMGTWEQAGYPAYNLTVNKDEVKTAEGKKAKLKYLRVFPEDMASISQWETNQNSPRYGHPSMYMINQADPYTGMSGIGQNLSTLRVHWSRVLHVADNRDSSDTNGSPSCRPVYNRLLDCVKLYGGSAEMYWAGAFPGISAETHPQLGGDVAIDKTEFRAQMKNWYNSLQRWLGMSGMSFKMLSPTVVDPKSQIDVQLQAICILLGVPLRIFMGSERGELASNTDDTTWTDRVRFRLHSHLTPHLIVPFLDRLIWLGVLPEPKTKKKDDKNAKPGYSIVWPDLKVLSPAQKAAVALQITQALASYIQSGMMDLIEPLTYLTKVIGWDEKEARAYIEATLEEMKARNPDVDEADLHVGQPPQPPMDEFSGGGSGFPPEGPEAGGLPEEEAEPTTQEAVENAGANCGIGSGGFKPGNKCAKGGAGLKEARKEYAAIEKRKKQYARQRGTKKWTVTGTEDRMVMLRDEDRLTERSNEIIREYPEIDPEVAALLDPSTRRKAAASHTSRPGDSPELIEAMQRWTNDKEAVQISKDADRLLEGKLVRSQDAALIMQAVADEKPSPDSIYRGLTDRDIGSVKGLKKGEEFRLGLKSFATDQDAAETYGGGSRSRTKYTLEVRGKNRHLQNVHGDSDMEVISGGRFKVVGTESRTKYNETNDRDEEFVTVVVRQVGVDAPRWSKKGKVRNESAPPILDLEEPTTQEAVDGADPSEQFRPAVAALLGRLTGNAYCKGRGPKDNSCSSSGGSGQAGDFSSLNKPPPRMYVASRRLIEKEPEKEFRRSLTGQYPYGLPCFHEAPIGALDSIMKNGLTSSVSAEDTNFATVGKPSGFVLSKDKLIVEFMIRKGDYGKVRPDMRYDQDGPEADLLREHRGIFGADISYDDKVPVGDLDQIYVVQDGRIVESLKYPFKRPVSNAFCKTGKGGGRDPTCGKGKKGAKKPVVRQAKLQDVKRSSKDYRLLSEAKRQQVLNRDIDFYTSIEMYRSVKMPGYKRLDPKKQLANREIGMLQGKARAYLDRAEAFDGSDRRMMQHIALGYFEQAHKVYNEVMQPKRRKT